MPDSYRLPWVILSGIRRRTAVKNRFGEVCLALTCDIRESIGGCLGDFMVLFRPAATYPDCTDQMVIIKQGNATSERNYFSPKYCFHWERSCRLSERS